MADIAETTLENTETSNKGNLKSAISEAIESTSKSEETSRPVEKTEKAPPDAEESTEEAKDDEKLEAEEAVKLFRALKNPETRGTVIQFLAEKAGILGSKTTQPLETKADVKEAANDLTSLLKESLGDQFEFLADKFAPAIEKYLDKKRQEDLVDIRANLEQQEREKLELQSSKAITKLTDDHFGEGAELPADVQKEMSKFMDKVPPSAELSVKDYIELAFNSAIGKLGLSKVNKPKEEKINRNRSDSASRLESDRSGKVTAMPVPNTSKTMTLKQAIESAIEAASKE